MTSAAHDALSGSGSRYMIVDLGGGTADITVHEKQDDETLKELYKASGGPWGGIYVDNNYVSWLEEIFGKNAMDRLKKEEMADYFELLRVFEIKKRTICSNLKEPIILRISAALKEKMEEETGGVSSLEKRLKLLNLSDLVGIRRDKMFIDPEIVRRWFDDHVDKVISHIKRIFDEPHIKTVNLILLVGGFGESRYVHDKFKTNFTDKHIIVTSDAGLVVLKGAVRFGHAPTLVSARVMQLTYGIECWAFFDNSRHPEDKMFVIDGKKRVCHYFQKFVSIGQTVPFGHEVTYSGIATEECLCIPVVCSTDANPAFTTEPNCKTLGELIIKPEGCNLKDEIFKVTLVFGETELTVKGEMLKTGREFRTKIDCLK